MIDLVSQRDGIASLAAQVLASGGRGATTRFDDPPQVEGLTLQMVHSTPEVHLLDRVAALVDAGQVVVPITHRFAFEELPAAFALLREGVIGKIAVSGAAVEGGIDVASAPAGGTAA
jgi:NADPH:quinone reductase-like Zn-dependent oxidoreductase